MGKPEEAPEVARMERLRLVAERNERGREKGRGRRCAVDGADDKVSASNLDSGWVCFLNRYK